MFRTFSVATVILFGASLTPFSLGDDTALVDSCRGVDVSRSSSDLSASISARLSEAACETARAVDRIGSGVDYATGLRDGTAYGHRVGDGARTCTGLTRASLPVPIDLDIDGTPEFRRGYVNGARLGFWSLISARLIDCQRGLSPVPAAALDETASLGVVTPINPALSRGPRNASRP